MTTTVATVKTTTDSTDRTPALTARVAQPKSARIVGTARRLLSALMRSLATPHV
jgi:hypothetical protein